MIVLNPRVQNVHQVGFTSTGEQLLTAGSIRHVRENRGIEVWEFNRRTESVNRLFPKNVISGFTVNPAIKWVYVGLGEKSGDDASTLSYYALDLSTGTTAHLGLRPGAFALCPHPSGAWFAAGGFSPDWRSAYLFRWRQPEHLPPEKEWELTLNTRGWVSNVACGPDRNWIITRDCRGGLVREDVFELSIRDSSSGTVSEKVPIPGRVVDQLVFSPSGKSLIARAGPSFLVWDVENLHIKPRKIRAGSKQLTALAFHPTGRYLAATSNDQTVKLYDTESWEIAKTFTWDIGRMRSIAFSPDGMLAAAGSDSGKVVMWDVDV